MRTPSTEAPGEVAGSKDVTPFPAYEITGWLALDDLPDYEGISELDGATTDEDWELAAR